jgi:hypothetical protein
LVELIHRYTLLPCLTIEQILLNSGLSRKELIKKVNAHSELVQFLTEWILARAYEYKESVEVVEEELELTKQYPFKINIDKRRNNLVVYKKDEEEGRLGFHIDPYSFDSGDEKNLFRELRRVLDKDEAIVDIYFTGGVIDVVHNDFYFEYYSPQSKRLARYFPDFLIETSKGRFLVIEVKKGDEKLAYEKNKKEFDGNKEELFSEVFAKELGFRDFKEINKGFEYHIIFDASLQDQQKKLFELLERA